MVKFQKNHKSKCCAGEFFETFRYTYHKTATIENVLMSNAKKKHSNRRPE